MWNIYFKGSSDVWLDSGQKASLKKSCFVSPHKLLTSEQWYEHKSQNVTCAFNLQDSHVWSHRLRFSFNQSQWRKILLSALWRCTDTLILSAKESVCVFFFFSTFGFCVVILVQLELFIWWKGWPLLQLSNAMCSVTYKYGVLKLMWSTGVCVEIFKGALYCEIEFMLA